MLKNIDLKKYCKVTILYECKMQMLRTSIANGESAHIGVIISELSFKRIYIT